MRSSRFALVAIPLSITMVGTTSPKRDPSDRDSKASSTLMRVLGSEVLPSCISE
ncbi:hypothetical protein AXFE_37000 [Acidithrix ferrooxidans]|uniref:Uncharacterized protein n=1 Tax=Acidithrix ferrooxidans TaxID=1280514 RepID=A0A0D8HCE4_9ACTN|nr:hypothetical protein AXFE_37000 [Acidithrix ferrooxidans]